MGKAFFQIAGVFAELERSLINSRTKAGIKLAKQQGVKFGRKIGIKNKYNHKAERIRIFLSANKNYAWISNELSVANKLFLS